MSNTVSVELHSFSCKICRHLYIYIWGLWHGSSGDLAREASTSGSTGRDSDEEDVTLLLDDSEGKTLVSGELDMDGIAEPLYSLLGEVFDLHGVFKWLRKTLITFVQITYGRTINRWYILLIFFLYW